jgi:hypothetical protein
MRLCTGVAFRNVSGKLYPVVAMGSHGAHIRVNFGADEFRYKDLSEMLE